MRCVIAQHFILGAAQRGFYRLDLVEDVDAVPLVFHHARKSMDLTRYAVEARDL